jgi:hypothetical protein
VEVGTYADHRALVELLEELDVRAPRFFVDREHHCECPVLGVGDERWHCSPSGDPLGDLYDVDCYQLGRTLTGILEAAHQRFVCPKLDETFEGDHIPLHGV